MAKILLSTEPTVGEVVFMGVGVVFLGLVCIIGILYLMSYIISKLEGAKPQPKTESAPAPVQSVPVGTIPNRQEIIAAVCSAVAEENGTDISAIRVISFKKV